MEVIKLEDILAQTAAHLCENAEEKKEEEDASIESSDDSVAESTEKQKLSIVHGRPKSGRVWKQRKKRYVNFRVSKWYKNIISKIIIMWPISRVPVFITYFWNIKFVTKFTILALLFSRLSPVTALLLVGTRKKSTRYSDMILYSY
jgi:hypothetical protein